MSVRVLSPTPIEAVGTAPKLIEEYVGRVNSDTSAVSIARMVAAPGWEEPGQRPEFDEFTLVLQGSLLVEHSDGSVQVGAGQAVIAPAGSWVRYSAPEGATYVAVCLPAFSPDTVHRDPS